MNKFRNVPTEVDGIRFASQREARRYSELAMLAKSGIITNLELQRRFDLKVNGIKVCSYIADFTYRDSAGRECVEDVKGVRTAVYSLKAKLMNACHGIRVVEV